MAAIHSGRLIGCLISPVQPGRLAWVEIFVRSDKNKGRLTITSSQSKQQTVWSENEDPICGYIIWHIEIDPAYEKYVVDYDLYADIYEYCEVDNQDLLEDRLRSLGVDFTHLKVSQGYLPHSTFTDSPTESSEV
jgi:hypothetical protein